METLNAANDTVIWTIIIPQLENLGILEQVNSYIERYNWVLWLFWPPILVSIIDKIDLLYTCNIQYYIVLSD